MLKCIGTTMAEVGSYRHRLPIPKAEGRQLLENPLLPCDVYRVSENFMFRPKSCVMVG